MVNLRRGQDDGVRFSRESVDARQRPRVCRALLPRKRHPHAGRNGVLLVRNRRIVTALGRALFSRRDVVDFEVRAYFWR